MTCALNQSERFRITPTTAVMPPQNPRMPRMRLVTDNPEVGTG